MQRRGTWRGVLLLALCGGLFSLCIPFWAPAEAGATLLEAFGLSAFPPGLQAPDFVTTDIQGNQVRLDAYRGKLVLLVFWATWCPACHADLPVLDRLYQTFKARDFVVLAVNIREPVARLHTFQRATSVSFPLLLDLHSQIMTLYQVEATPTHVFIDRQGQLLAGGLGGKPWASHAASRLLDQLLTAP